MDELESQIAKIVLGNNRSSSAYVYVMAEKAAASDDELFVVAELPMFNPAAEESCERICQAIASTFRRAYGKPGMEHNFEGAIATINDELGKLASLGQTEWVSKLGCILAVKDGNSLSVATTGKTAAFLLRNREFTDISCSPEIVHPLKTFENYSTGKIRMGDLLILSTTQLFNYLSMDRLLSIMAGQNFLTATQTIIELLKETADPQISFGVVLNLQVPLGQTAETDVDLENYVVERPADAQSFTSKILAYVKTAFAFNKNRAPKTGLPKVSLGQNLKNISQNTKNFMAKGRGFWQTAKTSARAVKTTVNPGKFRQMSPIKKLFFASAAILLIAFIANLVIAVHLKKVTAVKSNVSAQIKQAQGLLDSAQSSMLYKDYNQAGIYLAQAKNKLPDVKNVPADSKDAYNKALAEISNIEKMADKTVEPKVDNLGSLGRGNNLIALPDYAATQDDKLAIISYNKQNGKIQDGALTSPQAILASTVISGNVSSIYDGTNLYLWDFTKSTVTPGFNLSVPTKDAFGGMAYYPTNKRVYVADKKSGSIINFLAGAGGFSRPVVAFQDPGLNQAISVAIDGSIYVLTSGGITKYQSGRPANFTFPATSQNFSGKGKIYTEKGFNYLYVLDAGNNRILAMDKTGNLIYTLKSSQFTSLTDFQVDEKNKILFVLNDGNLLKVALP